MRLRRSRGLACYWHEGSFVVHPYPHGTATALPPVAAEILSAFEDWTDPAEAAKELDHLTPDTVEEAVAALHEAGTLLTEGSAEAERDEQIAREWSTWAPEASFFHYATQDLAYDGETAGEEQSAATRDSASTAHRPAIFTSHPDADRLLLPRPRADLRVPYDEVLHARHTCRDFTRAPVPLATLATLLATVFGPVEFIDSGSGVLFRRTSPAGGCRQELDAYVGVLNVSGVDPGFYHYNLSEHSLELLSEGFTPDEANSLCADQDWVGGAGFVVVLSAVLERMSVKYRTPRCYRVSLLDAGHLGQTFALTATALGLGPAQTGAFDDSAVAERCRVDNVSRTPLYVLAAGLPAEDERWAPPPARVDTFRRTVLDAPIEAPPFGGA